MHISKRTIKNSVNPKGNQLIKILFLLPISISIVGLFFIFEASSITAFREIGNSFHYFKLQTVWLSFGFVGLLFFSFFPYKRLYYFALPLLVVTIISLILVIIPHITNPVLGARRWISILGFNYQPAEFAKFTMILYLSSWFLYKEKKRFIPFMGLMIFMLALIMGQPDLGTATIIILLSVSLYFIAGENITYLIASVPFWLVGLFFIIRSSEYRWQRFLTFLHPSIDTQGISYHVNQIAISLSGGGLFGRGFSESRQKYQFLPEAHTDSIFAIIGEEIGFLGALAFIVAYAYLLFTLYKVSVRCKDRFGMLLSGAVFCVVSFQVLINLCGMVGLVPLTGVPLPFLSYGGSSLLVFYCLLGITINIARTNHI